MITEIIIKDNKKAPIHYLSNVFDNDKVFSFKPGINIIIGPNGCGKTTLMKLIQFYTLCNKQYYSSMYKEALEFGQYFDMSSGELLDGVDVKADYQLSTFNFMHSNELKNCDVLSSIDNTLLHVSSNASSTGQSVMNALKLFFQKIFGRDVDLTFPLKEIRRMSKSSNNTWQKRFSEMLAYYKRNHTETEPRQYTILMDEPDRNLDIDNLEEIYHIVSTNRPDTQLICVIHNQVLINRLSKKKNIHFIELENGYLDKVIKFVNKKTR